MSSIQNTFSARVVDHTGQGTLTDGGVLWEIVTPEGERIASCEKPGSADALEKALNMALTEWLEEDEEDRTVDGG